MNHFFNHSVRQKIVCFLYKRSKLDLLKLPEMENIVNRRNFWDFLGDFV